MVINNKFNRIIWITDVDEEFAPPLIGMEVAKHKD
jgi:hypothetical protein